MHRQTNRPGFIQNGAGNGLPDPPGGVGGKLISLFIIKTKNRPHQPQIAFLNQVGQGQSLMHITFGNGDNQTKVCPDHGILGNFNGAVIGLQPGIQLKEGTLMLIPAGCQFYAMPHVVQLLFFGF